MNAIPRLLHQTWKSRTALPDNFVFWRQSFAACNPGIEVRLYDDDDNRALLAGTFPSLLPLYEAFPREIFRADFIRQVYLFRFGGVYADMDFQCLQPLDDVLNCGSAVVLGRMGTDDGFAHSIPNAIMFSRPGEGFWIGVLAFIEQAWRKSAGDNEPRPERVTGPVVLRKAVRAYLDNPAGFAHRTREFIARHRLPVDEAALSFGELRLLPAPRLYPLNWCDPEHRIRIGEVIGQNRLIALSEARALFPQSLAVTYWAHSWEDAPPVVPPARKRRLRWRDTLKALLGLGGRRG